MTQERESFPGSDERVLRKVVICAAITGAAHAPTMSDYLPLTPKQVIDDAVGAYEAGAAMVHIHARRPEDGLPTPDLKIFREILSGIKSRCNAVIIPTTGGAGNLEERIAVVPEFKPEMATLNLGSMNMGGMIAERRSDRVVKYKFAWEEERAKNSIIGERIWQNSFKQIREYATIDKEHGTKPELEIWDLGQIGAIEYLLKQDLLQHPVRIQFVMGAGTGMPATLPALQVALEECRRRIGTTDYNWSVCVAGRDQFPIAAHTLAMGGHVRVGLEDNLYCGYGRMAKSSGEQVERIVAMARPLSIKPATPDEARQILGLKGSDKVNF
ncbi:3-keto-5-aminohexanoate cleavage protein [Chloroflexota bacterium]